VSIGNNTGKARPSESVANYAPLRMTASSEKEKAGPMACLNKRSVLSP